MRNSKDKRNNKLAINKRKLVVSNRQSKSIGYIVRIVALVIMLIALVYSQNNMVFVNDFTYSSNLIPKAFNGYKIVIISDIHNKTGGILKKVNKQKPDIALVTGGYVDKDGNYNKSIELINNIGKENVTYYVLGEEDLEYKDSIINGISYAEHLDNYFVTINPTVSSKEEFISKYVDDWIIDEAKKDDETDNFLVDMILDKAGNKGTGKWTSQVALDIGSPIPSITEAVFSRYLSAMKDERVQASEILSGPSGSNVTIKDKAAFIEAIRKALYASKICAYAQGFDLMLTASREYKWNLDLGEIAKIFRGGCIIRAQFLNKIYDAYNRDKNLSNILLDDYFSSIVDTYQSAWREVIALAVRAGVPIPGFTSALSYYDGYRSSLLPANLIQAQRDYFGAHTYERVDVEGVFHTNWQG